MKNIRFKFLLALIALVTLTSRCKDKNNEVTPGYAGNYTISSAVLAEPLPVTTVEGGVYIIPASTPLTSDIQAELLGQVNCTSTGKSWLELRKDNSVYFSCAGENAIIAGTWEQPDATTLKLNMNNTAISSSPTGLVLTITDLVRYASGLRGQTIVPISKATVSTLISGWGTPKNPDAPLTLDSSSPDTFNAAFYIYFLQK
jgi:hypothetical protein